ncbi:hypothetical protein QA089_003321 [Meyerozyma guilliermondii]
MRRLVQVRSWHGLGEVVKFFCQSLQVLSSFSFMSFSKIPVVDLSQADTNRSRLLDQIRHALIEVGFLLLTNYQDYGPTKEDISAITEQAEEFFKLPQPVKDGCSMIHSKHFLGYTRLANEITAGRIDWREQIDLATELPAPPEDAPIYRNIEGPNLWPDEKAAPKFRPVVLHWIDKMTQLSTYFRQLVCEALGIDKDAMEAYFKENQQCKMKIVAYPDAGSLSSNEGHSKPDGQGVGPHRDSDFLTYIHQATPHTCLEVQNFQGEWISVENVPDTLVVNVGQTLEAITQGVCKATIHRVITPKSGSGTRISIPFFSTIDLDARKAALGLPDEVLKLRDERDKLIDKWAVDVGFQFSPDLAKYPVGRAVFQNRIKSHQDVAQKWWPEIYKEVMSQF